MQENNSEILLYKTEDGEIKIDVYFNSYNLYRHYCLNEDEIKIVEESVN